jgi:hypothetical protein
MAGLNFYELFGLLKVKGVAEPVTVSCHVLEPEIIDISIENG